MTRTAAIAARHATWSRPMERAIRLWTSMGSVRVPRRTAAGTVRAAPAALMPQRDLLLPWLGALDNACLALRARGVDRDDARRQAEPWLERFGLADAADRRASTYSGGMRRRLDLAATLVGRPRVVFLDEPSTGLDPRSRAELWEMVRELRGEAPRFCSRPSIWRRPIILPSR